MNLIYTAPQYYYAPVNPVANTQYIHSLQPRVVPLNHSQIFATDEKHSHEVVKSISPQDQSQTQAHTNGVDQRVLGLTKEGIDFHIKKGVAEREELIKKLAEINHKEPHPAPSLRVTQGSQVFNTQKTINNSHPPVRQKEHSMDSSIFNHLFRSNQSILNTAIDTRQRKTLESQEWKLNQQTNYYEPPSAESPPPPPAPRQKTLPPPHNPGLTSTGHNLETVHEQSHEEEKDNKHAAEIAEKEATIQKKEEELLLGQANAKKLQEDIAREK